MILETNMKNNTKLNFIYLISGFILISYIFYTRILVVRLPRDLNLYLNNELNIKLLIIISTGITLSIYLLMVNLLFFKHKVLKETLISATLLKLKKFIERALFEVYNLVISIIPNSYERISKFSSWFYSIFGNKTEGFFVYLTYAVRFFILFTFLVDVLYFFKFNYFYKSLILLCIPLVINFLIFALTDFANNFDDAKSYLIINALGLDEKTQLPITSYSPSPGNEDINLEYHIEQFILCSKIKGYLNVYNLVLHYYSIRCNIIIYSLYLIGWLYIILHSLGLL